MLNHRKFNSAVIFIPCSIILLLFADPILTAQPNIDLVIYVAWIIKRDYWSILEGTDPTWPRFSQTILVLYTLRFFGRCGDIVKAASLTLYPIGALFTRRVIWLGLVHCIFWQLLLNHVLRNTRSRLDSDWWRNVLLRVNLIIWEKNRFRCLINGCISLLLRSFKIIVVLHDDLQSWALVWMLFSG